jgi:hypothetical protein
MNILCGSLNQTEGNVYVGGIDMRKDPEAAKRLIGFLPQNPPLVYGPYRGRIPDLLRQPAENGEAPDPPGGGRRQGALRGRPFQQPADP